MTLYPSRSKYPLSASRVLRLKTYIKLHKEKLKKSRRKIGTAEEPDDQLYCFLQRERVLESKLGDLLGNIIPIIWEICGGGYGIHWEEYRRIY